VKAYTAARVTALRPGEVVLCANTGRWDPYTPWKTLIPESMENPFAKKLHPSRTEEIIVKSDFVIFAAGVASDNALYHQLKATGRSGLYLIGDSRQPASAWDAITGANEVARQL
jgi:2-enoate reductase